MYRRVWALRVPGLKPGLRASHSTYGMEEARHHPPLASESPYAQLLRGAAG